jgi:hypothetical protein
MKTQRLAAMLAMTAASLCAGQSAVTQKATVMVCMESDSHGNEMRALKVGRATVGMAGMMQAEAPKPESKIQVLVYNYAGVSSETLARVERAPNRTCLYARTKIQWLDCPLASKDADQFPDCQVVPGPTGTDLLRRDILFSPCRSTRIPSVQLILLDGFAYAAERREILKLPLEDPALKALASGSDSTQERGALRVEIYDYANLEPDAVRGIVTTTQQILARTGMSVQVSLCHGNDAVSCDNPSGEGLPLVVRIIPGGAKTMSNVRSERLGQSYVDHDGGIVASVFLAGARKQAAAANVPWITVLSYAAAHEVGHLLLGDRAHASRGVMRAQWNRNNYMAMSQNQFDFTSEQSKILARRYGHTGH